MSTSSKHARAGHLGLASPFHPTSVESERRPRRLGSIIGQALFLDQQDAHAAGEVGFLARALVQAPLPDSDPKANEFVRRSLLTPHGALGGSKLAEPPPAAVSWLVEANGSGAAPETGILWAQVALELLAWVHLVETQQVHRRKDFNGLSAAGRIRALLDHISVPAAPPGHLKTLPSLCSGHAFDGTGVLTPVPNDLVHPTDKSRASDGSESQHGWAQPVEVARAFDGDVRTARRQQRRFEEGGLSALGRPPGFRRGRARVPASRREAVDRWKAEGGVESGDRPAAGHRREGGAQARPASRMDGACGPAAGPPLHGCGPKPVRSSGSGRCSRPRSRGSGRRGGRLVRGPETVRLRDGARAASVFAGPRPGGSLRRPAARPAGLLEDGAPLLGAGTQVPGLGVLLAIPALVDSGVFSVAREIDGGLGPAFYGLRATLVTLLRMALARFQRPEGLQERSPRQLGQVLGLDRAPEVKTLCRKLARLAVHDRLPPLLWSLSSAATRAISSLKPGTGTHPSARTPRSDRTVRADRGISPERREPAGVAALDRDRAPISGAEHEQKTGLCLRA